MQAVVKVSITDTPNCLVGQQLRFPNTKIEKKLRSRQSWTSRFTHRVFFSLLAQRLHTFFSCDELPHYINLHRDEHRVYNTQHLEAGSPSTGSLATAEFASSYVLDQIARRCGGLFKISFLVPPSLVRCRTDFSQRLNIYMWITWPKRRSFFDLQVGYRLGSTRRSPYSFKLHLQYVAFPMAFRSMSFIKSKNDPFNW